MLSGKAQAICLSAVSQEVSQLLEDGGTCIDQVSKPTSSDVCGIHIVGKSIH